MTDERRREIVYATLELAAENGLGTVSMQQIADKVGIRKASLYNHFSSRDEIVETMYDILRQASKERGSITVDYEVLVSNGSMKDILLNAVDSYQRIVNDPQMSQFYKIVMSERPISKMASEIMVKETRTMIDATRRLFDALNRQGLASFDDIDAVAFSFSMTVHSIIDYQMDLAQAGMDADADMLERFIEGFCRTYGTKKE